MCIYIYYILAYPRISSANHGHPAKKEMVRKCTYKLYIPMKKNIFNDCKVTEYPVDLAINHGLLAMV